MNLKIWLLVAGSVVWLVVCAAPACAASSVTAEEIQSLIAQLGDEQYLQRQLAEEKLLQHGVEAFAALQAAEHSSDLEIATRAKYIVNQIRIEWSRPNDPVAVRSIMARYGDLSLSPRLSKIEQLAKLDDEQGWGALCRIARFDASPLVARRAALAMLKRGLPPPQDVAAIVTMVEPERGESNHVPVSWINVYLEQLQSPEQMDPDWLPLIDAELALLEQENSDTNETLALSLLRVHLELADELSDAGEIFASLRRRVDVLSMRDPDVDRNPDTPLTWILGYRQWQALKSLDDPRVLGLVDALTWLIYREQWEALHLLEEHYATALANQRWLLYIRAVAYDLEGDAETAKQLADRAAELELEPEQNNRLAEALGELGRYDMAETVWQEVVKTQPATAMESLMARNSLGLYRLHDRGDDQAAADLLAESIEAINADPAVRQQYRTAEFLPYLRMASANREFFLAFHHEREKDYAQQRRHLDLAYRLSPGNADVLIAMYRLQDADQAYRQAVEKRVAGTVRNFEQLIKQNPNDAQDYNQWAWLVANTEGDFDKAVERSLKSLEIEPGNPSYLDTLGRCYYAAGDLENAVKVQREAIAKQPHLLVMQRQLELFEEALENESKPDGSR